MSYDDANQNRRSAAYETVAGANGVSAKYAQFQAMKLVATHVIVTTAGTSVGAGNCAIIKNGTTAVGTATLGTLTASSTVSLTGLAATVPSLQQLTATNGTDATGKCLVVYEIQNTPDQVLSS